MQLFYVCFFFVSVTDAIPPSNCGISEVAWIPLPSMTLRSGYQPAQKWLKDRRGRSLSFDDVTHYQRIVKVLAWTDRIMREIDLPLEV
jgi:hypothetical protein